MALSSQPGKITGPSKRAGSSSNLRELAAKAFWDTMTLSKLAPNKRSVLYLVALLLITGCFLPGGNCQSTVSPRFEDFRVSDVYVGLVKAPDFGDREQYQGTDLRCFGDDSTDYARQRVNFSGHFVIGSCTCGTGCHYLFMWDAVSGKFYQRIPPGAIDIGPYPRRGVKPPGIVYRGEQYHSKSSLLVVEGCAEDTCDCAARYYRWTGTQFQLIARRPVRMPEACLNSR